VLVQCVAVCWCSVLQCCIECGALCKCVYIYSGTNGADCVTVLLQCVTVCCSVLQCVVAVSCCSVLQCCIECGALCKYVYIYSGTNGVESVTMLLQCVAVLYRV